MAKYITPTGAGAKDGTSWANAWGVSEWLASSPTGENYFFAGGTYTITSDWDDDTWSTAQYIGVKAGTTNEPPSRDDWAFGEDRPLLVCGAYKMDFGRYVIVRNLRFTTTYQYGVQGSGYAGFINCKSENISSTADYYAFQGMYQVLNCEAKNVNGYGIGAMEVAFSYIHDCKRGHYIISDRNGFSSNNIFYNCTTTGLSLDKHANWAIHNTFIDCNEGIYIYGDNMHYHYIFNNMFENCTTGIKTGSTGGKKGLITNNNFSNCTTRISNTSVTYIEEEYYELDAQIKNKTELNFEPQNTNLINVDKYPDTFRGTNTVNKSMIGACPVIRKPSSTTWVLS